MRADSDERELFLDAAARGAKYLAGVRDRAVAPDPRAVERLLKLGGPLSAKGMTGSTVLALLISETAPELVGDARPTPLFHPAALGPGLAIFAGTAAKYAARSARSASVSVLANPCIVGCQRLPLRYWPSAATR